MALACLDGAGAASEAAHEPRIAGALAHWSAHPMSSLGGSFSDVLLKAAAVHGWSSS